MVSSAKRNVRIVCRPPPRTALQDFAAANGISLVNVPEPMSAGIMVMAGLGILRRRQRR